MLRSLAKAEAGSRFQFERLGYFFADPKDSKPGAPVFNRTVTLKDTWAKLEQKEPSLSSYPKRTVMCFTIIQFIDLQNKITLWKEGNLLKER